MLQNFASEHKNSGEKYFPLSAVTLHVKITLRRFSELQRPYKNRSSCKPCEVLSVRRSGRICT